MIEMLDDELTDTKIRAALMDADAKGKLLFEGCRDVNDIENTVLEFWNRLNPSCIDPPHYTHNGHSKVVIVDCRPACRHSADLECCPVCCDGDRTQPHKNCILR